MRIIMQGIEMLLLTALILIVVDGYCTEMDLCKERVWNQWGKLDLECLGGSGLFIFFHSSAGAMNGTSRRHSNKLAERKGSVRTGTSRGLHKQQRAARHSVALHLKYSIQFN